MERYSITLLVLVLATSVVTRAGSDATTKTNVNQKTDYLEKNIDDLKGTEDLFEQQKDSALGKIENKEDVAGLVEGGESAMQSEIDKLSSMGASDLNSKGTEEMIKQNTIKEYYVDYSRPINKRQLLDANNIAKGQEKLMGNLLEHLKQVGVDCETVEGSKVQEPEYHLEITNNKVKEEVYNQAFCEEPRTNYKCVDVLKVECVQKGEKWGDWEFSSFRRVDIIGHDIKRLHKKSGSDEYYSPSDSITAFCTDLLKQLQDTLAEKKRGLDIDESRKFFLYGKHKITGKSDDLWCLLNNINVNWPTHLLWILIIAEKENINIGQIGGFNLISSWDKRYYNKWEDLDSVWKGVGYIYRSGNGGRCLKWEEKWERQCAIQ